MLRKLIGSMLLALLAGCDTAPPAVLPYVLAPLGDSGSLDLYLYDLDSGTARPLQQTHLIDEYDPDIDPAGQRVAFITRQTFTDQAVYRLHVHHFDTGLTDELLQSAEPLYTPVWSNNAKQLAYVVQRDGKLQINILETTSKKPPRTVGFGSEPSWRVDNRALFYNSRDTTDAPAGDLMVYELSTGVIQSLSLRGNSFRNLQRGTSIVYTSLPYSRRNQAVWLLDANSRQTRLSSPGLTHRDTDPVHINGTKFVAFTRTDAATHKASIFVVERYAQDPVETPLIQGESSAYTRGSERLNK